MLILTTLNICAMSSYTPVGMTTDNVKGTELKKDHERGDAEGGQFMVLHHIVTAVLCLGSWALNYTRIGSIVMFLHDVSDIPLDVVRLSGR